jgi:hypothetical protein
VATVKDYLLMLSKCPLQEFSKFGVSETVLNGLVSVNQFIQMDGPLTKITAPYLLHAFARSCALVLPPRAPGLDLLIPVLRSDNKMSVLAIQVKNLSTTAFPANATEVNSKLNPSYLDYLAFSDSSMDPNDFIRVVIQFTEESSTAPEYKWCVIPQLAGRTRSRRNFKALWLRGLECFHHLFFDDESILANLELILSGNRDFLKAVDLPTVQLPTILQTTRDGLRFMASQARHLSCPENVYINDRSVRDKVLYKKYLEKVVKLQLPVFANEHRNNSAILLGNVTVPDPIPPHNPEYISQKCKETRSNVVNLNLRYSTKAIHIRRINDFYTNVSATISNVTESEWAAISPESVSEPENETGNGNGSESRVKRARLSGSKPRGG